MLNPDILGFAFPGYTGEKMWMAHNLERLFSYHKVNGGLQEQRIAVVS